MLFNLVIKRQGGNINEKCVEANVLLLLLMLLPVAE